MLKNFFFLSLFCFIGSAYAQMPYIEEAKSLGTIAGQGLACEASKYQTFELLARAIILTKSPSDSQQSAALQAYMEKKADVFVTKQLDKFADCQNIARRFDAQDIFKATLYADGTIKMPDGQIITPRVPYDAASIYDIKSQDLQHANEIYNRDLSNIKKVDFIDTSLTTGNQQKSFQNQNKRKTIMASPARLSRKK